MMSGSLASIAVAEREEASVEVTKISVLIVDDHPTTALGAKVNLESQGDLSVVGICNRGDLVLREVADKRPDVVLLDLALPGMSGADVAVALRERFPDVKILAFSAYLKEEIVLPTVKAGVDGYIVKTQPNDDLIRAVRTVAAGQLIFNAEVMDVVRRSLPASSSVRNPDVTPERLTERELQVLELVARDYQDRDIAETLSIEPSTVKTHVHHILEKMSVDNRDQAALIYRTRYPKPADRPR
jgi:DNA-binding NarL/FixJ family response regulator